MYLFQFVDFSESKRKALPIFLSILPPEWQQQKAW